MYAYLLTQDLRGKTVLVVGCGFGDDALRLAKLGTNVHAFDLSPDSLAIARARAVRAGLTIDFREMPAERLDYADSAFDYVVARDILHHVDIPLAMKEIVRVAKPDAIFIVNEIYSHSLTDRIRRSSVVQKLIYPRMRRLIYGPGKPYITEDERKLTEHDLEIIRSPLQTPEFVQYFNFIVTRLVPDRIEIFSKLDQLLLRLLRPIGHVLAGRVLFSARIIKSPADHAQ
jgi:ubiquinone/menaquinone biosynthesis C-methylase UbiE